MPKEAAKFSEGKLAHSQSYPAIGTVQNRSSHATRPHHAFRPFAILSFVLQTWVPGPALISDALFPRFRAHSTWCMARKRLGFEWPHRCAMLYKTVLSLRLQPNLGYRQRVVALRWPIPLCFDSMALFDLTARATANPKFSHQVTPRRVPTCSR